MRLILIQRLEDESRVADGELSKSPGCAFEGGYLSSVEALMSPWWHEGYPVAQFGSWLTGYPHSHHG